MTRRSPAADEATTLEQTSVEKDDEVGHRHPPLATRFRPGQSGNPKGRPKGAKNLRTITLEKLQARIPVREGGRKRRMSKAEIGITKLVNRFAETGDPRLFMVLLKLLEASSTGSERVANQQPLAAAEEQESNEEILAWFLEQHRANEEDGS